MRNSAFIGAARGKLEMDSIKKRAFSNVFFLRPSRIYLPLGTTSRMDTLQWMTKDRMSIPVDPASVHLIRTPAEFYETLMVRWGFVDNK